MANGTKPGPTGADAGSTGALAPTVLGLVQSELKPVPQGIGALILFPPPRLCQFEIYKGTEGMFGCWATVAEVIVRARNSSARFQRPSFEALLSDTSVEGKVRYMDFVENSLESWGFRNLPGGMLETWDDTTAASALHAHGPLLCVGKFWDGFSGPQIGGMSHAIAVFGAQDELVYYRDPWDGVIKTMDIGAFNRKGRADPFVRHKNVMFLK